MRLKRALRIESLERRDLLTTVLHLDATLVGRDCTPEDGQVQRREREFYLLRQPSFREAYLQAGFTLAAPSDLTKLQKRVSAHAA